MRHLVKVIDLDDNKMLEAMEFRETKKQHAQRRLREVSIEVKTARYRELDDFMEQLVYEVAQLHS